MLNQFIFKPLRASLKIHLFCFLCVSLTISAQKYRDFQNIKLQDSTIYMVCRGTKAKSGFIAEKFNLQDKNSTHVGIGYLENRSLKIFNVSDTKSEAGSSLIVDSLNSFITKDTYYISIWKCNNKPQDFENLKKICEKHKASKIKFDFSFNIEDDEKMYCSEFCCKVLVETNGDNFQFRPSIIQLDGFYKSVVHQDQLTFYPVDFFQANENFTKIYDSFIDNETVKL